MLNDVNKLVQGWCDDHPELADPYGAWGQCAIASQNLAAHLVAEGVDVGHLRITGREYIRREHWALVVEVGSQEFAIDVTARQFDPEAPFPLIKEVVDWLDDACEWLVDGLDVFAFPLPAPDSEPLWTDVHVREEIEPGPITYYPQPV